MRLKKVDIKYFVVTYSDFSLFEQYSKIWLNNKEMYFFMFIFMKNEKTENCQKIRFYYLKIRLDPQCKNLFKKTVELGLRNFNIQNSKL